MPKSAGGLNVISMLHWNRAPICKLLWAAMHKKDIMWVRWVHCYYIKSNNLDRMTTPKQACWVLREIFDAREWIQGPQPMDHTLGKFVCQGKLVIKNVYI